MGVVPNTAQVDNDSAAAPNDTSSDKSYVFGVMKTILILLLGHKKISQKSRMGHKSF